MFSQRVLSDAALWSELPRFCPHVITDFCFKRTDLHHISFRVILRYVQNIKTRILEIVRCNFIELQGKKA